MQKNQFEGLVKTHFDVPGYARQHQFEKNRFAGWVFVSNQLRTRGHALQVTCKVPGLVWRGEPEEVAACFQLQLDGVAFNAIEAVEKCLLPLKVPVPATLKEPEKFQKSSLAQWLEQSFCTESLRYASGVKPDITLGPCDPKQRKYEGFRIKLVAAPLYGGEAHLFTVVLKSPFCRTLEETKSSILALLA